MAKKLISSEKLDSLANMIAAKSGEAVPMTLDEMTAAVHGIPESSAPTLETVTKTYTPSTASVTDTITPSAGYDGIAEVGITVDAVPLGSMFADAIWGFYTDSGVRRWYFQPTAVIDSGDSYGQEGYIPDHTTEYGATFSYRAVPSGTTITPTESAQTLGGSEWMMEKAVTISAIPSNYVGSGIPHRVYTELTASGATVTAPSGYYESAASKTISSGTATAPSTISGTSATVSTGTNTLTLSKTVSNTPQVTAGYVSAGTAGNSNVSLTANVTTKGATTYHPSASQQTIASGTYLTGTQTINAVTTTNLTSANIKSGVVVQVGDSSDSDCVTSVTGTYSGGGAGWSVDTKTVTASNYPVSISFTSMKGEPKAFFLKSTSQISSSGSTTYYYIIAMRYNGTNTTGSCFRIGSTRRVDPITSGYSWSYSGTTLTITSSAASRSASPGAFNNGYELTYFY